MRRKITRKSHTYHSSEEEESPASASSMSSSDDHRARKRADNSTSQGSESKSATSDEHQSKSGSEESIRPPAKKSSKRGAVTTKSKAPRSSKPDNSKLKDKRKSVIPKSAAKNKTLDKVVQAKLKRPRPERRQADHDSEADLDEEDEDMQARKYQVPKGYPSVQQLKDALGYSRRGISSAQSDVQYTKFHADVKFAVDYTLWPAVAKSRIDWSTFSFKHVPVKTKGKMITDLRNQHPEVENCAYFWPITKTIQRYVYCGHDLAERIGYSFKL